MKAEEKYKLMTREQRKVAIAKDVIKQINAGVFDIRSRFGYIMNKRGKGMHCMVSKDNALGIAKQCGMCARGALMISRIAKFNEVKIHAGFSVYREDTIAALEDAFTENELSSIESAFEGSHYFFHSQFHNDHKSDANRLIAICQNIVDHKGFFRPEVRYDVKYVQGE